VSDLTRIEERFRMANPIPDPANPPLSASTAAAALLDLEKRRGTMQTDQTTQVPTTVPPQKKRRLVALTAAFAVVAAVAGIAIWLSGSGDETTVGSPRAVVEEFLAAARTGGGSAGSHLLTPEFREEQQDFENALGVWNARLVQPEECSNTFTARFRCVVVHYTDFHEAGGLSPFEQTMTFSVNEAGLISDIGFSVAEWDTKINPFNTSFMSWILEAHPEEAARMSGPPMGDSFNSEDAEIALQYVDEFVAQSDLYPEDAY